MAVPRPLVLLAAGLRRRARSSKLAFILIAVMVGVAAGLASVVLGSLARTLQHRLYAHPPATRLSELPALGWPMLLVLPLGGAVMALFSWATRARTRRLVDAVEANALHGGRMSMADSLVIAGQTSLSNGFGASVGLEAAYAQLGGALASLGGRALGLRRADLRVLVGAGAGATIAAAFGAPLTGAFYAFEIVIGAYTPSAIVPVAAAALRGTFVAQALGAQPYVIAVSSGAATETHHYLIYVGLALICALVGVGSMRAVGLVEAGLRRAGIPSWARPALGGALLMPVAAISPQALSGGHGALSADLTTGATLGFIVWPRSTASGSPTRA